MKHVWIPIWRDGCAWQLWTNGEYLATVGVGRYGRGTAYVPSRVHPDTRPSKRVRRFKTFKHATAYVKGLCL